MTNHSAPPDESDENAWEPCPLGPDDQRRNILLFAVCTGMIYLAAPVLYVGITQASLCDRLGADARIANLPATVYFAMTAMPAVFAWAWPSIGSLRRNLSVCYLVVAAMLCAMSIALVTAVPQQIQLALIVLQGAVSGSVMPFAIALLWEAIGRGTGAERRGTALSLAFGGGPLLAVVGSLGSQLLLSGSLGPWKITGLAYPWNFACVFAAGVPPMLFAAWCSSRFVVPLPDVDVSRAPFDTVSGLCAGLVAGMSALVLFFLAYAIAGYALMLVAGLLLVHHFRDILSQRVLLIASIVTVLLYAGNNIPSNMNLYTNEVLTDLPENYAGYQNSLRFGFKVVAGVLLGWVLTRTHPKAGMLLTGLLLVAAQLWAIFATGTAYLIAFGIFGAGELVGVYAPNYMLAASSPSQIRRNMAYVTMLMAPAAPAGYLFGTIADFIHTHDITAFGVTSSRAFGFQVSFAVCAAIVSLGLILAAWRLPAHPAPMEVNHSEDSNL